MLKLINIKQNTNLTSNVNEWMANERERERLVKRDKYDCVCKTNACFFVLWNWYYDVDSDNKY